MSLDPQKNFLPITLLDHHLNPTGTVGVLQANETPILAMDVRPTLLFSPEDAPGKPDRTLLEFSLRAIREAMDIDLSEISDRIETGLLRAPDTFPGQHYKLLAAMVKLIQPKLVIEIGTASGYSCLSLKKFLRPESKIVTFDVIPWKQYPDVILRDEDFADQRLEQKIADLTKPQTSTAFQKLFSQADFIFVDAAKDGVMEQVFLNFFETVPFEKPLFIFFDDIRLWNMLKIWRLIQRPKLDLTSFGSWSGSGLIHWIP